MIGEIGENIVITSDNSDGFSLDDETIEQYREDGFNKQFRIFGSEHQSPLLEGLLFEDSDDELEPIDTIRAQGIRCESIEYLNGNDWEEI